MSAMDNSKIKREICDRITKLSYKRPKTEKEHNQIVGAKMELEDLLKTIRVSEGNTESSINYDGLLGTVDCEYEHLFISDEGEPCPIDGWMPIATSRIKHPERIPEYIKRGRLRKIKP